MTSGNLWNYYRDKINEVDNNASDGKSFEYKTKIVGETLEKPTKPADQRDADQPPQPLVPSLNIEVTIPL